MHFQFLSHPATQWLRRPLSTLVAPYFLPATSQIDLLVAVLRHEIIVDEARERPIITVVDFVVNDKA